MDVTAFCINHFSAFGRKNIETKLILKKQFTVTRTAQSDIVHSFFFERGGVEKYAVLYKRWGCFISRLTKIR